MGPLVFYIGLHQITAKLIGALAVVKVTLQGNWISQFSGVAPPPKKKKNWAIKMKSGTNYKIGEGNAHAKFGNIEITLLGASPHIGEI